MNFSEPSEHLNVACKLELDCDILDVKLHFAAIPVAEALEDDVKLNI